MGLNVDTTNAPRKRLSLHLLQAMNNCSRYFPSGPSGLKGIDFDSQCLVVYEELVTHPQTWLPSATCLSSLLSSLLGLADEQTLVYSQREDGALRKKTIQAMSHQRFSNFDQCQSEGSACFIQALDWLHGFCLQSLQGSKQSTTRSWCFERQGPNFICCYRYSIYILYIYI